MYHDFTYEAALASSLKAQWHLDDVLRPDQELDFTRNFLPEGIARTAVLTSLTPDEQRVLNQISAHQYICMFGIVEEFVLPFLLDHARPTLHEGNMRIRALLNFATEEVKHIQLFRRFHAAFQRRFPVRCKIIGPPEQLCSHILSHDPLSVALIILMIEWMTQAHYLEAVRDDSEIEPLFKSLLKHHWMEEAQHAKLDTLIVDALAARRSRDELPAVMDDFFRIARFLDNSLRIQAELNIEALERATRRKLPDRDAIMAQQHRAARWTYLGSGMVHERFRATLGAISPKAAANVAAVVAQYSGAGGGIALREPNRLAATPA
jgi:hypothetical protein